MTKLEYGDGKLLTQQGITKEGHKCLTFRKWETGFPINSKPEHWQKVQDESAFDVVITFSNLESARVLQDELNELISVWSRELAPVNVGQSV